MPLLRGNQRDRFEKSWRPHLVRSTLLAVLFAGVGCVPEVEPASEPAVRAEQVVEELPTGLLAQATPPPAAESNPAPSTGSDPAPATAPDPVPTDGKIELDTWDVVYFQDVKVGYGHMTVERFRDRDRELLRIEGTQHLSLKRFGQANEQEIRLTSIESPDGQLVRFDGQTAVGPTPISVRGEVRGDELVIDSTTEGRTTTRRMPWKGDVGGFFALEMSLLRAPMKPGEKRTIQMLAPPLLNQVELATLELTAKDYEAARLLGGTFQLLRIDSVATLPGGVKLDTVMWTDRLGNSLKSSVPAVRQDTFRATEETALGESHGGGSVDLGFNTMVKVSGRPIPRPHATRRVRYSVTIDDGDPASVFSSSASQTVKSAGMHKAEITVRALRPDDTTEAPAGDADRAPTDEERKANGLIQSDDPRIVAMARKAAGDQTDAWKTAVALERYVHDNIRTKNFSQAFATAAEVAETLEGDCTEHAVLLAALARARDIPSRVVIGLVYVPSAGGFGYHMWTEVYVAGRWIPLDATLGRGGIGAAHLKLTHSSLAEATAYSCFLPVATVLGRLKIEVLDVE